MNSPRKYASAAAFRVALEERLKRLAQLESLDLQRVRRQAAFDRLLCRLFAKSDAPWLLKGGYAMELRMKTARTTRDIDLALRELPTASRDWDANATAVLEALRETGQLDLDDFFTFGWQCDSRFGRNALRRSAISGRYALGRTLLCEVSLGCEHRGRSTRTV